MKFDFIIGNPPYQKDYNGTSTGKNSIYHHFIDSSFEVGDKIELITPARFLFDAGSTPKKWNQKMLNNNHLKVLYYEPVSTNLFKDVDIKGGIVITLIDKEQEFETIKIFTPYPELNSIIKKIFYNPNFISLSTIAVTSYAYHFTNKLYEENPELWGASSKEHDYDLTSNTFERMPTIFSDKLPTNSDDYIKVIGRLQNKRTYRYVKKAYVNEVPNLYGFKVFIAKASGTGDFGETLSLPVEGEPGTGSTESFLSIGNFKSKLETQNTIKYIKTKFARALLGILKVTQDITPRKWRYVPLQDFTENSDIDWTKSVYEIDRQLYSKYNLSPKEINFIETHIKEML